MRNLARTLLARNHALNHVTGFGYSGGERVSATDALGQTVGYAYDIRNRVACKTDALLRVESYHLAAKITKVRSPRFAMHAYTAVIEHCPETKLYVGYVPGFPGAHSQGATLDELHANLREVIAMLLEDGEPKLEAEFVGTQTVLVG